MKSGMYDRDGAVALSKLMKQQPRFIPEGKAVSKNIILNLK